MTWVFTPAAPITKAEPRWVGRLSIGLERQIRPAILAAVKKLKGNISTTALATAAASGSLPTVLEVSLVRNIGALVLGAVSDPAAQALVAGADSLNRVALDMGRPRIAAWLRDHGAELMKQVNGTSRDAVRAILEEGVLRGRHPRQMAQDIKQVVGLTEPQSIALARRRQALIESGAPALQVERVTQRYGERLLTQRAQLIAEHETMTALNRGRFELWQQLREDGALEAEDQREWLTAMDEMVCPICGPMHGQRRPLGEPYMLPSGVEVDHPPAHVRCRCTEVLV